MEDLSVIYGLEDFQARTLVAQAAENEKINFIVGTQSLKNTNQVQLIEFDDDSGAISKQHFEHSSGEIWSLASAPRSLELIATVYYNICDLLDVNKSEKEFKIHSLSWALDDDSQMVTLVDNRLVLWDVECAGQNAKVKGQCSVEGRGSVHLGAVRWCPHQNATQVACTFGSNIVSFDVRSMKQVWMIENTHSPIVRDFAIFFLLGELRKHIYLYLTMKTLTVVASEQFGHQYYLASCGDDGAVKFWDIRNSSKPLLTRFDHSHWVWSVRFNASYDHAIEDGILHTYEDHEESVYAAEWSSADFWTFASISFDGRFVINKVPKSFKYKQFM
ncbi:Protein TSSC1 [Armadillidium vulgare]|nr:Protein TSSC1 [Armadillidium vulgare]